MNNRSLRVLEFDKIIKQLEGHTATTLGTRLASKLKPATNIVDVQEMHRETDEAMQIIRLNKSIPLGGIFDIQDSLKRSLIGSVLSTTECLEIASTIYGGRQVKNSIEKLDEDLPILQELATQITSLRDLEQSIRRCIDDQGNVLDSASGKLRGIRSSIRTFESRVRGQLESYTRTQSNLLSDAIVTIRNNRYVLPVKHEHRHTFGGIVHDQSASGQTLFMEPQAVVDINNQLQEAKVLEKQEIERILRKLTSDIAEQELYLRENITVLANIDFIFARATLGAEMKATMPEMNDQGIIQMHQVRHPLIPSDEVVANDVEIGKDFTAIVITGPNTGGKTVALKMIGLCTLMAQSGLQIPALDGCKLAVFKHILADIGDEQSIEQNLSTFSSHMTNIVNIIDDVDNQSLVLFDELGAGTDPQEGAALAMAILDEVISRDARVIATTHYPELKAYGYNREKVVNASVEFNVETLQPTYRLLIGTPGRSNAFDISTRLGLSKTIIDRAKSQISVDSTSVENMITSLEESKKLAEETYEEAHEILLASEELRLRIEEEWRRFERERENLYKVAEEKADRALQNARVQSETIVTEIRKMKENTGFKEHKWIEAQKELDDARLDLSSNEKHQDAITQNATTELSPGDDIKILTINRTGTVLEQVKENEYLVQVGAMRVNIKRSDLQLIDEPKQREEKPVTMVRGSTRVSKELDLRGERYEEAMFKLETYLDDALLGGHHQVTIIHGKGTGALRKGVHEFLKQQANTLTYRTGKMGEGGDGITIIEFN